jgi:hypothetical protein
MLTCSCEKMTADFTDISQAALRCLEHAAATHHPTRRRSQYR